jgi:Domain of unknown function (DUF4333)
MPFRLACTCLLILLAGVGATACGGEEQERVGGKGIEKKIRTGIDDQLDLQVDVACPKNIERGKGKRSECDATVEEDGSEFPVEVRQTDDKGNITWNARALPTGPIEDSVASEIFSQRAIRVELECPEAVSLEPDTEFQCLASDPKGNQQYVAITVEDDKGNVSWEVVPVAAAETTANE